MITSETPSSVNKSAENLTQQSKSSAEHLTNAALNAGDKLGSAAKVEFDNIMHDLQDLITRAGKLSGQELVMIRHQISEKLGHAKDKLQNISQEASSAACKGVNNAEQIIKEHPLQSVGVAAVAGLVLGCLLSRR